MPIIRNGASASGVGVHRALSNLSGRKLILDSDGDTSITADTDDQIDIEVAGNDELRLTATALYPVTDDGLDLGIVNTNEWGNLFLADGAVINFNNSDVTLTHASNKLTIAGGVLSGMTHSIWGQAHAIANTATLSAVHVDYANTILGSDSADGSALVVLRVPADFVTLSALKVVGKGDGTGNMYYSVEADYGATGQSHTAHTGAISTTSASITDNQMVDIDISAVAGSLAANDTIGIEFIREGSNGSDNVNHLKFLGIILEYTT